MANEMRQAFNWLLGYWSRFADILFPDRNQNQQQEKLSGKSTESIQNQPVPRLYYSIPGKAFTGYINKGHILKTEDKWPLAGN